ncbi:MAG: ParB/Srx family N-terminal domain-containing protein [Deltaproteobacteria bacterium]|nr:ParB/Srx family N-terminal domain-containing protein [Deltaproteobacteria bacterium]
MDLLHYGLKFELRDDWWVEAGMVGFDVQDSAYKVNLNAFPNVYSVSIKEVGPVHREGGVFKDDNETGLSAKERVTRILRWFREDVAIEPVEVVKLLPSDPYRYKLVHGAHRFYCSLAAGFTHVPAVDGFDWASLDQ